MRKQLNKKSRIDGVFISTMFLQDFKEETQRLDFAVQRLKNYISVVERKMENGEKSKNPRRL